MSHHVDVLVTLICALFSVTSSVVSELTHACEEGVEAYPKVKAKKARETDDESEDEYNSTLMSSSAFYLRNTVIAVSWLCPRRQTNTESFPIHARINTARAPQHPHTPGLYQNLPFFRSQYTLGHACNLIRTFLACDPCARGVFSPSFLSFQPSNFLFA